MESFTPTGKAATLTDKSNRWSYMVSARNIGVLKRMRRQRPTSFSGQIIKITKRTPADDFIIKEYGKRGFVPVPNKDFYPWFRDQLEKLKTMASFRPDLTIKQKMYQWFVDFLATKVPACCDERRWESLNITWGDSQYIDLSEDRSFVDFMYNRFVAFSAGTLTEEQEPVLPMAEPVVNIGISDMWSIPSFINFNYYGSQYIHPTETYPTDNSDTGSISNY